MVTASMSLDSVRALHITQQISGTEAVVVVGTSQARIGTVVIRREQHRDRPPCGIFPNVVATTSVFAWHSQVRWCMSLDPEFCDYREDFVPDEAFLQRFVGRET